MQFKAEVRYYERQEKDEGYGLLQVKYYPRARDVASRIPTRAEGDIKQFSYFKKALLREAWEVQKTIGTEFTNSPGDNSPSSRGSVLYRS